MPAAATAGLLLAALVLAPGATPCDTLGRARELLLARQYDQVVVVLEEHLKRSVGDVEVHDLLGQALLALERKDEAAHHFEAALSHADAARARELERKLAQADGLQVRRRAFFKKTAKALYDVAAELWREGHAERARDLLAPLVAIAEEPERGQIEALLCEIRAASQAVDLDAASSSDENGAGSGERALIELESEHYLLKSNLELEVTQLVADTMDDIFGYYVRLYFDGKVSGAMQRKATIRIHPDHASMLVGWQGASKPGGWWSPGEWTVVCYDTRTTSGTLDEMLMTLFHEASHQFMSLLDRGGGAPAWLNEGTASFFEGATAMADHRVLWPDAARGRLQSLAHMLRTSTGPSVADVIGYSEPGSYPPEYYPFGWGLVYFMQQYEDPTTLEYVFRPLYAQYRDRITTRGGDPKALFDELFLAPLAPGKYADFEAFAKHWQGWIRDEVWPLFFERDRGERRLRRIERYVAAAAAAAGDQQAKVPEAELLERALGDLEFVRREAESGASTPDAALLTLQADLLERLGRPKAAAPVLETLLTLADEDKIELTPERYAELEQRLTSIDKKNAALRTARARAKNLAKTAYKLLEDYQAAEQPMPLRCYTFAQLAGEALHDDEVLLPAAARLRAAAREAGLLLGSIMSPSDRASDWRSNTQTIEDGFSVAERSATIEGVRFVGRIDTSTLLNGEYELRFRLGRAGKIERSSFHGVVVSGRLDTDWIVAGIDGRGILRLRRLDLGSTADGVTDVVIAMQRLEPPLAADESPQMSVHVLPEGKVRVRIGEREEIELDAGGPFPRDAHIGIFAKNARTELTDFVVELFP
jgi:hypothetical protein